MLRISTALLFCAAAHAATTLPVNLVVNATLAVTSSAYTASGTAKLTGGITDSGTFSASVPLSALTSSNTVIPYTMTFPAGTMAGNLTIPIATILSSGSGTGSATVTSASGTYAGDTGTFPTVAGSGGFGGTGAITLSFSGSGTITTGGTVSNPPPTITAVQDAASYTSNIAQGSIFVVKGSNLSTSGYTSLSYPLTTSSAGTSITFTPAAGGAGTQAYLIYTYSVGGVNQLAAILPSTVAPGNYNVTVTYGGTPSAAFATQVVTSKPGIITQDSTGSGLAAAQVLPNYTLIRLTTGSVSGTPIQPAHPGDTVVVYGTGLGPVTFADNTPVAAAFTFPNVQVILGGTTITPLYAGRTPGASGLDQVSFTLPANVPTGCAVSLQISESGNVSTVTTLSIAPSGSATACVYQGLTTSQLQALDNGGTISQGTFSLSQFTSTQASIGTVKADSVGGEFTQLTGFELSSTSGSSLSSSTTIGSCTVYQSISSASVIGGGSATSLDAGALTISGPAGTSLSNTPLSELSNDYSLSIGEEGITLPGSLNGKILPGSYTLAGAGGKDVGSFSVSLTLGPLLSVTGGLPPTVTESAGVTLNWTGGNASDPMEIRGSSITTTGSGANTVFSSTSFICTTTAGAGTFTVPPAVLTQLPKITAANGGSLSVYLLPTASNFNPSLTAGGTVASTFGATVAISGSVTYQ